MKRLFVVLTMMLALTACSRESKNKLLGEQSFCDDVQNRAHPACIVTASE